MIFRTLLSSWWICESHLNKSIEVTIGAQQDNIGRNCVDQAAAVTSVLSYTIYVRITTYIIQYFRVLKMKDNY